MKSIPAIQKFMTPMPHTIGKDATLEKADHMMHEFRVRHLPVLDGGQLVGILSERDIQIVETLKDVDPKQITVEEAYTPDPYITKPSALLSDVCKEMAEHKYGCALVVDNKKLVGIFTWVDGLKALTELLETRLAK